ncbi:hypothetical protein QBC45DRAFT_149082 [Copromyces sp. CBS 386.78]|nr:hypothetical protein QBC45DRAFT_149082 [Copromyces sp. CBS 386.78]
MTNNHSATSPSAPSLTLTGLYNPKEQTHERKKQLFSGFFSSFSLFSLSPLIPPFPQNKKPKPMMKEQPNSHFISTRTTAITIADSISDDVADAMSLPSKRCLAQPGGGFDSEMARRRDQLNSTIDERSTVSGLRTTVNNQQTEGSTGRPVPPFALELTSYLARSSLLSPSSLAHYHLSISNTKARNRTRPRSKQRKREWRFRISRVLLRLFYTSVLRAPPVPILRFGLCGRFPLVLGLGLI